MLHFIINSSIIWLAFLWLYQFLLQKESFHQLSRIYLLFALGAGLLLPNINLNRMDTDSKTTFIPSAQQVVDIKNTYLINPVHKMTEPLADTTNYIELALWSLYALGVIVGFIMLLKEIIYLIQLFRNGKKRKMFGCTIVETQEAHCPFSIFHYIFVSAQEDYTPNEWNLVLDHEKEHVKQYHTVDNILLIVFRIVFWFNPLSHIYFQKLRIVHEFQADKIGAKDINQYGSFLLDLNLLQKAPLITHSLNYSPLKIRIAMLTQSKSTRIKLLKYVTVFPLLLLLIICCTHTSFSEGHSSLGATVRYKNNTIEFGEFKIIPFRNREAMNQMNSMFLNTAVPDSLPVYDPVNRQLIGMEKLEKQKVPVKLNDKMIYGNEPEFLISKFDMDYQMPVLNTAKNLEEYIMVNLKNEVEKLDDGRYEIRVNNLVIDDKGKIAFFEGATLEHFDSPDDQQITYTKETKQVIEKKLLDILQGPIQFKPAMKNGKPINVRYYMGGHIISIKNHQSRLVERPGC